MIGHPNLLIIVADFRALRGIQVPFSVLETTAEESGYLLYSGSFYNRLEWRNWQTHGTQNPASFTRYVGSTPTSSTNLGLLTVAT